MLTHTHTQTIHKYRLCFLCACFEIYRSQFNTQNEFYRINEIETKWFHNTIPFCDAIGMKDKNTSGSKYLLQMIYILERSSSRFPLLSFSFGSCMNDSQKFSNENNKSMMMMMIIRQDVIKWKQVEETLCVCISMFNTEMFDVRYIKESPCIHKWYV